MSRPALALPFIMVILAGRQKPYPGGGPGPGTGNNLDVAYGFFRVLFCSLQFLKVIVSLSQSNVMRSPITRGA